MSTHLHEQSQKPLYGLHSLHGRYKVFGAKGHIPGGSDLVSLTPRLRVMLVWLGQGDRGRSYEWFWAQAPHLLSMRELSQAEGFH